jgi:hypothetical protein
MSEFKIGAYTYRAATMDLLVQTNVTARLLPLIAAFKDAEGLIAVSNLLEENQKEAAEREEAVARGDDVIDLPVKPMIFKVAGLIEPLTKAVAALSDDDRAYVIDACLSTCSRCEGDPVPGKQFVPIWNKAARRVMFQDIKMVTAISIVVNIIQDQVADFLSELPSGLSAGGETTA